ncbi:MAG: hypothetical protein ABIX28_00680, partial [Vicinamibacterales bacterium]
MSWRLRPLAAGMAALAALAAAPAAPRQTPQSAPVNERPAPLIVDFAAIGPDGAPLPDLLSTDIEIRIGDRVRTVRALRRVAAAPPPAAAAGPAPLAPPFGTNDDVAAGRRFIVVVDQESFGAGRELLFRNAVEGLVAHLNPADKTMVAALPFGGVTQAFTSDGTLIRMAMNRVSGQGARSETGSQLACRTRRFLESLEGFLRGAGTRTAPVTLVLFTSGLAAPRRDAPMGLMPGMCELLVDQFRRLATVVGAARTNLYVMHPADVGLGNTAARTTLGGTADLGADNPLEGIEHLAGATGATRLALDAGGTASLLRVARETAAYYVAEVEPGRGEVFGRSRPLDIRTGKSGVTLRTRPEITFVEVPPPARQTLNDLLASTDAFGDLRLRAGAFSVRDADGRLRVGVLIEPNDAATALSSVGATLFGDDGRPAGRWTAKDAAEHPLLGAMVVAPGSYRLRVAAIDRDGRQGVAEGSIDAQLTPVGSLSLGSLMLSVSRAGASVLQLQFGSEPTATASFDIYGGAAGLRLSAMLEVARTLDGPPLVTLPLVLTRADETRVVATGVVPVGALTPGDYAVRGIIRLD